MENDINKIIGKNLLLLRKQRKLTQLELAEKLSYSDKSISKWEKGESLPSIEILYELAKFYNVSLDALTREEADFSQPAPEQKSKREKFFPKKLCITLLAVSAIWLVATVLFVSLKLSFDKNYYTCFVWAVPASAVMLIIFNSIWGKAKWLFYILTVLVWTFITALYLQLIKLNIWPIYILGIPLQVAATLALALTKPKNKKPKLKKEKGKKSKNVTENSSFPSKEQTKQDNSPTSSKQENSTDDFTDDLVDNILEKPDEITEKIGQKEYNQADESKIEVTLPQITKMPNNINNINKK